REKSIWWLYGRVLRVLPRLIPQLIIIWFKTRQRQKRVPFLEFAPLLDQSLLEIRQQYNLLLLIQ
ncbi:MAG: hypothetical protein AAF329_16870, partial [Cyanobacteria bacterium P01_A01_bin.17]